MLQGKVGQATKFINHDSEVKGVHKLTRKVKSVLSEKHPVGEKAQEDAKLDITSPEPEAVIFEAITADCHTDMEVLQSETQLQPQKRNTKHLNRLLHS